MPEVAPPDGAVGGSARRATIDDVARVAGVSRQTVSNVVRGRGRVGESTRLRVQQAIDQVDYRPHAAASRLRSRLTGCLGHPMPVDELHPGNLGMIEFLQSLVVASGSRGQRLLLGQDIGHDSQGHGSLEELVRSGSVDGIVLANVTVGDGRPSMLARRGIPFACFGRPAHEIGAAWVDIDNHEAVQRMTEHLIEAGHTRIGFVGYDTGNGWDLLRESGYRDALTAAGMEPLVALTGYGSEDERAAVERLVCDPRPPTAVVTGSDVLAAAAYAVATRHGLAVGSDLAVTGVDGGAVSRMLTPSLTTVAIPFDLIASRLVDRVLDQVDGAPAGDGEVVEAPLRVGDSA